MLNFDIRRNTLSSNDVGSIWNMDNAYNVINKYIVFLPVCLDLIKMIKEYLYRSCNVLISEENSLGWIRSFLSHYNLNVDLSKTYSVWSSYWCFIEFKHAISRWINKQATLRKVPTKNSENLFFFSRYQTAYLNHNHEKKTNLTDYS